MTVMRTIIELPEDQLEALDALCRREKISRAEGIRRAVAAMVRQRAPESDRAFGLWRDRAEDGVAYQRRLRSEWRGTPAKRRGR